MRSWFSRTRRGRAVVPLHWVHAGRLRLSSSVRCVLCQRPISAHGLSCWITWASNLTSVIDGRTTPRPAPKPRALWHELGDLARESDSLLILPGVCGGSAVEQTSGRLRMQR